LKYMTKGDINKPRIVMHRKKIFKKCLILLMLINLWNQ
jgi:hypothetical protein